MYPFSREKEGYHPAATTTIPTISTTTTTTTNIKISEDSFRTDADTDVDADAESLLLRNASPRSRLVGSWNRKRVCFWFLQAVLVALALGGVYIVYQDHRQGDHRCEHRLNTWSPALDDIEYETVMFEGAQTALNKYKGYPSPSIDAEWNRVIRLDTMKISAEALPRLNKSLDSVQYPPELGGSYMATIEVFHQLHCVNLLRQFTYREYYDQPGVRPMSFTDSEPTLRKHIDHCIDILRQLVMCTSDVSVITANWVRDFPGPYPDFSVMHKCRNFEKVLHWSETHQGPEFSEEMKPPLDAVVMDTPP